MCQPWYAESLLGNPVQFVRCEEFLFLWFGFRLVKSKRVFRNPSVGNAQVYDFTEVLHVLGGGYCTAFHIRTEEKFIARNEGMVNAPDVDVRFAVAFREVCGKMPHRSVVAFQRVGFETLPKQRFHLPVMFGERFLQMPSLHIFSKI